MNHLVTLLLAGLTAQMGLAAEKGSADFYQSAPHEYLGKEIRLRVASVTPVPELTAADKGYVWMEAATGRPSKEEGKILLRIPEADSAKVAKSMNLPSSSGRWLEGVFSGHDSGAVLPAAITQKAPYYIQISSVSAQKGVMEDIETASGSLVVAPKSKETKNQSLSMTSNPPAAPKNPVSKKEPEGPKAVVLRTKSGEPLQLRTAQSVKMEADFCEIIDQDGKLSLVGRGLVIAVLPLPKDGTVPTIAEAEDALRLYAAEIKAVPEASALLTTAKSSWEKYLASTTTTVASASLPELEDVDTAAGIEEPEIDTDYPRWFWWGTGAGTLLLVLLGWAWSRPRSTPA